MHVQQLLQTSAKLVAFRGFRGLQDVSLCVQELAQGKRVLVVNPLEGKNLQRSELELAGRFFASLHVSLVSAGVHCDLFCDPLLAHNDRELLHSFVLQSILRQSGLMVAPQDVASRISNQHGIEIVRVVTHAPYDC